MDSSMKSILVFLGVIMCASHAVGLTCYVCNYNTDSDCKGKDVDIADIGTMTDDDDACKYCYKQTWDNAKKGIRGCLDQKQYSDNSYFKADKCREDGIYEYCVCETDRCNGGVTLTSSAILFITSFTLVALV